MNIVRYARFFTTVVDEGHFGQAARRLGMTQPPLSQGLQRLETELGVRLLNRGPRGLTLTDAGAALLPQAQALLRAEQEFRDVAAAHGCAAAGLRLGVVPQLPVGLCAALAKVCSAEVPNAEVTVHTAPTNSLIEAIAAGRFDLGIVVHPAVLGHAQGGQVVRLPTALLTPVRLAPSGQSQQLRDLLRLPLAVPPREHCPAAHDLLLDTLQEHGVTAGITTVEDERAGLALVATAKACLLTADPHLAAAGVTRRPVPGDVLPLRVRVIWRPGTSTQVRDELHGGLTAALAAHAGQPESAQ